MTKPEPDSRIMCPKHWWQNAIGNNNECEACLLEQKELNQAREETDGIDSRMIELLAELDEICESIDSIKRNNKYGVTENERRLKNAGTEKASLIREVQTINQAWIKARINVAERMC